MKKLIVALSLITVAFSAQARGGADRNPALKNSMAGFVSESLEHSMRLFYTANAAQKDLVTAASVERLTQDDATVVIELEDGTSFTYNCIRFDEWSRGGTVHKKEVVCR